VRLSTSAGNIVRLHLGALLDLASPACSSPLVERLRVDGRVSWQLVHCGVQDLLAALRLAGPDRPSPPAHDSARPTWRLEASHQSRRITSRAYKDRGDRFTRRVRRAPCGQCLGCYGFCRRRSLCAHTPRLHDGVVCCTEYRGPCRRVQQAHSIGQRRPRCPHDQSSAADGSRLDVARRSGAPRRVRRLEDR